MRCASEIQDVAIGPVNQPPSLNYLHRFFDVTLTLPDIHIEEYLRTLFQRHGVQEYIARINQRVDFGRFTDAFCSLLVHYKMSFREVEVCARQYMLLAFSRSTSAATAVIFSGIAVVLRMKNPEAYRRYIAWDIPIGQLVDMIYGDLSDVAELNESSSAVEFICYLYEQALFGEAETEQAHELTRIFDTGWLIDGPNRDILYFRRASQRNIL